MTTLIGCRCKSGNIFSQALLIGRGLFLSVSRCESVLRLRRQMQAGRALRLRRRNLLRKQEFVRTHFRWFHRSKKVNRNLLMIDILCNFQRTSWKPRIIGRQQTKVCWWPSERIPPVPIPNTVVKTLSGENTWRATSWEDNSLPTSNLNEKENYLDWVVLFF